METVCPYLQLRKFEERESYVVACPHDGDATDKNKAKKYWHVAQAQTQ